jgi:hypothetical protein
MQFEQMSRWAFNATNTLNEITSQLEPDDKSQLLKIIWKISPSKQAEVLQNIFGLSTKPTDPELADFKK